MVGECTHDEYFSQFGRHLVPLVSRVIGHDRIIHSKCEHFNDIPLEEWDSMALSVRRTVGKMLAEANGSGGTSLADCVCSAKSAAKAIRGW